MRCNDTCCRPELDYPTVVTFGSTTPTARKEHICDECRQPITPGQTYYRTAELVDGVFTVTKRHTGWCDGIY